MRIEADIRDETERKVEIFYNLHLVTEFERIFKDCMNAMLQTCDAQASFWTHIQTSNTIDFNILEKDGERINRYAKEAEMFWTSLCKIHPNHPQARHKYAVYQREIRNNEKLALELEEDCRPETYRRAMTAILKSNDILFAENTAVLHVSGSKDSAGKILKSNKAVSAVLGYNPNELINSTINKVMPGVFARRHNDLMNAHFKTGKNKVLNKERSLFGLHKSGYCLPVKLLVKTIPQLENGFVHYVGLMIAVNSEYDYIITDQHGVISCMTDRLAKTLGVDHKWVQRGVGLNVAMLAPELLDVFYSEDDKLLENNTKKFQELGGVDITLMVPRGLDKMMMGADEPGHKHTTKTGILTSAVEKYNMMLNRQKTGSRHVTHLAPADLLVLSEYKEPEIKSKARCRVLELNFNTGHGKKDLKVRALEISALRVERRDNEASKEGDVGFVTRGLCQDDFAIASQDGDNVPTEKMKAYEKIVQTYSQNFTLQTPGTDNIEGTLGKYDESKRTVSGIPEDTMMADISPRRIDSHSNQPAPPAETPAGGEKGPRPRMDLSEKDKMSSTFELRVKLVENEQVPARSGTNVQPAHHAKVKVNEAQTKILDESESSDSKDPEIEQEGTNVDVDKYVSCWGDATSREPKSVVRYPGKEEKSAATSLNKNSDEDIKSPLGEEENKDSAKVTTEEKNDTAQPPVLNSEVAELLAAIAGDASSQAIGDQSNPLKDTTQGDDSGGQHSLFRNAKPKKKSAFNRCCTINETRKQLEENPILKNARARSPSINAIEENNETEDDAAQREQQKKKEKEEAQLDADYPSIMEADEPVARPKHMNIVDYTNVGGAADQEYVESDNELEMRNHFRELQERERGKHHHLHHDSKETKKTPKEEEESKLLSAGADSDDDNKDKKPTADKVKLGAATKKGKDGDEDNGLDGTAAVVAAEDSEGKGKTDTEKEEDKKGSSAGEGGDEDELSVASTETASRIHYSVRSAIDERFVPNFINKLSYMTFGLMLTLLGIAITFFVYQHQMYSSDLDSIQEISYSEERKEWLIDINLRLRSLYVLSLDNAITNLADSLFYGTTEYKAMIQASEQASLKVAAANLQDAQSALSLKTSDLSASQLEKINPQNVVLQYRPVTTLVPYTYSNTIWQTVMEIVVASFRVANMTISDINLNQTSVYMVMKNSLNSVYIALEQSTTAISTQIDNRQSSDMMLLLILLLVASGAMLGSAAIFLPSINNARCCKERVLMLFTELEVEEAKTCQTRCEKFKRANASVPSTLLISRYRRWNGRRRTRGTRRKVWATSARTATCLKMPRSRRRG